MDLPRGALKEGPALSGYLFSIGLLSAQTQTIAWMVIFLFASPAASAAYLTVSETVPSAERRALESVARPLAFVE